MSAKNNHYLERFKLIVQIQAAREYHKKGIIAFKKINWHSYDLFNN